MWAWPKAAQTQRQLLVRCLPALHFAFTYPLQRPPTQLRCMTRLWHADAALGHADATSTARAAPHFAFTYRLQRPANTQHHPTTYVPLSVLALAIPCYVLLLLFFRAFFFCTPVLFFFDAPAARGVSMANAAPMQRQLARVAPLGATLWCNSLRLLHIPGRSPVDTCLSRLIYLDTMPIKRFFFANFHWQ